MDFGYLSDVSGIDFKLPPDHPDTLRQLNQNARDIGVSPSIFAGCPLWTYKEWVGSYYPANVKKEDFLFHYARQFNTIELNPTYYHIPAPETVSRWRKAVPPEFRFCPKFPQVVSHEKHLYKSEAETKAFYEIISALEENLGPTFLQLPPMFGPDKIPVLERFILNLPSNLPLAIEFRHPGWFADFEAGREAFALLEACQVSTVITDVALRRDVLHMRLTTPTLFLRFNGYKLQPSDYTRINAWVRRIKYWLQEGLKTVYFFMHQTRPQNAAILMQYFLEQLYLVCNLDYRHLCKPLPQEIQGKLF